VARPASNHPTDGELEILRILWEQGPATLGAVRSAMLAQREVATTTVATMLKVMLEKNLVQRARGARGYEWSASVSRNSTARGMLGKLVDGLFDGSAQQLVTHIVDDGALTPDEIEELRKLLAKSRPTKTSRKKRPKDD
jgi:predicted transcriptional regulator